MSPPPAEPPIETILYKLEDIQRRRVEDRQHLDAVVAEIKAEMRSSIASIAYVSKEQFSDYKATAAKDADETRTIASDARKLALAALWVLVVAVIGGVIGLAFQVATA